MTSLNTWQENMVYDELIINERQKKDEALSLILDEVWQGCPSQNTLQALKERVITTLTVDKIEELLSTDKSQLCLQHVRHVQFNSKKLSIVTEHMRSLAHNLSFIYWESFRFHTVRARVNCLQAVVRTMTHDHPQWCKGWGGRVRKT